MRRWLAAALCCWMCLVPVFCVGESPELTAEEKESLLAALYEADIVSVRQAIERGFLTCEEVTGYYLERIAAYEESCNCFITLCDDAAEQARERDRQLAAGEAKGSLFGVPVVVKDNIHYAGYPTTNGRSSLLGELSDETAQIVTYLLEEGAVILGKTNMSTDAQDARASRSGAGGETKNAYNDDLASGGSSGGSAVAVSLNLAVAGLGTDTNSSLRYPAALNGCVALRPTEGLLSRDGLLILNSKRDTPGAITRTVMDQAIMLDVLRGGESEYAAGLEEASLEGVRIGVLKEFAAPVTWAWQRDAEDLDDEIESAFWAAVEELRCCGAEVIEVSLPSLFNLSEATFDDDSAANREAYYQAYRQLLEENELSAVIFPTYYHAPHYSGAADSGVTYDVYEQPYITNCRDLSSCIGIPEISVPIGRHSRGAGIGMEIAADKGAEQVLLDIAYVYTKQHDHREVPLRAPELRGGSDAGTLTEQMDAYDAAVLAAQEAEKETEDLPEEPVPDEPTGDEHAAGKNGLLWLGVGLIALAGIAVFGCGRSTALRRRWRKGAGQCEERAE